jgi:hypothetical protein
MAATHYAEVLGLHIAPAIDTLRNVRFAMFEQDQDRQTLYQYARDLSHLTLAWVTDFINGDPRTLEGQKNAEKLIEHGVVMLGVNRPDSQYGQNSVDVGADFAEKAYDLRVLPYNAGSIVSFVRPRPDTTKIAPEIWTNPDALIIAPTVRSYLWALLYQHYTEVSLRGTEALEERPLQRIKSAHVDPIFLSSDLSEYYIHPQFSSDVVQAVHVFVQGSETGRTLAHAQSHIAQHFTGASIF